jgi:anoctamin-10
MLPALVIALLASHGHIVLCSAVRHVLKRILWRGSAEESILEEREVEMREARVRDASLRGDGGFASAGSTLTAAARAWRKLIMLSNWNESRSSWS